ncbi:NlpC/P60 family protein [Kineococcus rhizosphaerae]|uniref:Cell wall-associated NlpC family hydrolase n=1 Tax=Kineococcus rhizosphaerae TaxID=559628 RepID=A0A2T0RAN1_9ACTN|nr:NlpC/P60 family protein [Kineococcus rhizosphaerae]PRY18214.1 cell wall-associated NlpC family hydrolase [Kineococcus rhizosphaerae]
MTVVDEIQGRIADIQARIASFSGQAVGQVATTAVSTASRASSVTSGFADALSSAGSSASGVVTRGLRTLSDSTTGQKLLSVAQQYAGTPYKWGGTTPAGFDCSGLVQYAAKQLGITLPRTAAQQATVGTEVPSLDQARPGDLVVLENGHHIGIYVGNGQMLHAPKTGDVVKVSKVWETPMTIRRLGTTAATAAAGTAVAATLLSGLTGATSSDASSYVRPASLSSTSKSAPYETAFAAAERKYGLPTGLLKAVAKQESGFDPTARSGAGAVGLMQFMPATARSLGIDASDPFASIDAAGKYLAQNLETFGSVPLALAAYNAGAGNVKKYGGVPPFSETQNYVKKITADLGSAA